MQAPAMLFVYARNGADARAAQRIVLEDQRVGFVRFRNPKFWETSGIAELLTVPGAKYNQNKETWTFADCVPEVWVLHGSPHASKIVAAYEAAGVKAKIIGEPKPKPKPRAKKKRASKKASSKKAAE